MLTAFNSVQVYQDINYGGSYTFLGVGTHNGSNKYFRPGLFSKSKPLFKSNDISSLKIPNGYGVILEASNGQRLQFVNTRPTYASMEYLNIPTLVKYGFNDRTVKVIVFRTDKGFRVENNGNLVEPFNYDFGKCQKKIIYVILAVMFIFIVFLFFKVYNAKKSSTFVVEDVNDYPEVVTTTYVPPPLPPELQENY